MLRRPVAVYRVIDEEELLGGEGLEALDGEHGFTPPPEFAARIPRAPRHPRLGGWGSTALAVAALVGVAGLLMTVASHVPAPAAVPAASPPLRPAAPPQRALAVAASPRRPSPGRPPRRPRARGARRVRARRSPRIHALRAPLAAARASAGTVAGLTHGPPASPAPFRADQEFGFER